MNIRPVSDLRNRFPEIEHLVSEDQPVYLTKNGRGSMVVLSLAAYERLTDRIERKLCEADQEAQETECRLSHEEVFDEVRKLIHA